MKTESISPIEILNKELSIANSRAETYIKEIQFILNKMAREGVQYSPTATPPEVAAAGAEFDNKRRELRNAVQNFTPAVFVMDLLDDEPSMKTMLEEALAFLRERHKAYVKGTKETMLAKITNAFKPSQVPQDDQPPKREPVRGVFGQDELPPLDVEIERIAKHVEVFPELKSLAAVVAMMNALNSRLELPDAKPKQSEPYRKGYVVQERPSPPQASTAHAPAPASCARD